MQHGGSPWTSVLVVIVVAAIFVFRNLRPQKLNMSRLWIMPGIMVILSLVVISSSVYAGSVSQMGTASTPVWLLIVALILGIMAGIPLGLARGHASKVRLADQKGVLIVEPSVVVMVIWLGAFALKYGLKSILPNAGPGLMAVSDGFLIFAVSSVVAVRYVLYTKFKELHVQSAQVIET